MVMTLRKRVPQSRTNPPSSPSPIKKKKPQKNPKSKTRARTRRGYYSSSESESESGFESDSDSDSDKENNGGDAGGGYESVREQRIKENKERMEKLGIFLLSSKVFDGKKRGRVAKNVVKKKANPPIVPRRRSQRSKDDLETEGICISDKWMLEAYTEEDEKLLGDCEAEWKLDVDGVGEDGDLLYDPVNGISCHHCRYKTLRKHTYCNKCRSPQGQLCGDCLYTRYGENVVEAVQNPKWTCPACRGICNCSRCRRDKGWSPVTIQYPKVVELGYKSIAHYLILKRHAGDTQKESENVVEVVDLTEGDAPAPPKNEDPDTCSEWSQSHTDDSDSDDSESENENNEQPIDMQVDTAEPDTCSLDVGTDDKNADIQVLNA